MFAFKDDLPDGFYRNEYGIIYFDWVGPTNVTRHLVANGEAWAKKEYVEAHYNGHFKMRDEDVRQ